MSKYRTLYEEIKILKPRPRGFQFEKLLNEMFDNENVLLNDSYKTADQSQQIDGALEINGKIFLMEAKWEDSSTLAASKLYSFLGKINSKIDGTLGVFISYNELGDNFVNAVRDGLKQNCILIHGIENIESLVNEDVKIDEFIWYCFRQASTRNRTDISVSEFQSVPVSKRSLLKISKEQIDPSQLEKKWSEIYKHLSDGTSVSDFTAILESSYLKDLELSKKVLNVLPALNFSQSLNFKINVLFEKLKEEEWDVLQACFINKLKGNKWYNYSRHIFLEFFQNKINVNELDQIEIIENICDDFGGDWEVENSGSEIFNLFYDSNNEKVLKILADKYAYIYCDTNRYDRFPQKQFSKKVIEDIKSKGIALLPVFKQFIINDLKWFHDMVWVWKSDEDTSDTLKQKTINKVYDKDYILVNINEAEFRDFLSVEYDKISKE